MRVEKMEEEGLEEEVRDSVEEERDRVDLDSEMVVAGGGYEDCVNEDCVNEECDYEDCGGDGHYCNNTGLFSDIRTESTTSCDTPLSRFGSFHTYWRRRNTYCIRVPTRHNQTLHLR